MNYDSQEYFELSRPHVSDETRRARRVLVFISTIVLSAGFLGVSITDVRIAGIALSDASIWKVTIAAIVVIVYWNIILWLNFRRDTHFFEERKMLLDTRLKQIKTSFDDVEEKIAGGSKSTYSGHSDRRNYLNAHREQLERMKALTQYDSWIKYLDLWLPHSLSSGAVIALIYGLKCAL